MSTKTALIAGITGQDGAYLAKNLLNRGYKIVGTSRDFYSADLSKLKFLGIEKDIEMISLSPTDFRSVLTSLIKIKPQEIYNLSGQTSVGLSFEQPVEAMESIAGATLNFLEAIRYLDRDIRFFNAGSSDCFGDTGGIKANEQSQFKPLSPYAIAKCASFWQVSSYRSSYSMYCCSGILSNHESPLRGDRFVTKKIVDTAKRIKLGLETTLELGNIDITRDWGWSPDYVEAMYLMLNNKKADDYIICTGHSHTLEEFIKLTFEKLNLDYKNFLVVNKNLFRPSDIKKSLLSPKKINDKLSWKASKTLDYIIQQMLDQIIY